MPSADNAPFDAHPSSEAGRTRGVEYVTSGNAAVDDLCSSLPMKKGAEAGATMMRPSISMDSQ